MSKLFSAWTGLMAKATSHRQIPPGTEITQAKAQNVETPTFETTFQNEEYEMRRYESKMWVSTSAMSMTGTDELFMRLFRYISGENDQKQKIAMTAPVLTEVVPGAGPNCETKFTMSFFVPPAHQEKTPEPTEEGVFLQRIPAMHVYVRAFEGFARQADYTMEAATLSTAIGDSSKYVSEPYFTVGYDSPFRFTGRRNEVWLQAKQPE